MLLVETGITIIFNDKNCDENENEKKAVASSSVSSKKKNDNNKKEGSLKTSFFVTEVFRILLLYKRIVYFMKGKK